MKGAHGLQPEHHEHVHCHYCEADGVHVEPPPDPVLRATGVVNHGPHSYKGSELPCLFSRNQPVPDEYRHQGDPT